MQAKFMTSLQGLAMRPAPAIRYGGDKKQLLSGHFIVLFWNISEKIMSSTSGVLSKRIDPITCWFN